MFCGIYNCLIDSAVPIYKNHYLLSSQAYDGNEGCEWIRMAEVCVLR